MKKLFAFAIATLMLFANPVYAEEYVNAGNGAFDTQVDVSCHEFSHYTVSVPTGLTEDYSGTITISDASIEEGYCIGVYVTNLNSSGMITLSNSAGDEIEIDVNIDGNYASNSGGNVLCSFDGDGSKEMSISRTGWADGAGTYTGYVCLRFDVIPN